MLVLVAWLGGCSPGTTELDMIAPDLEVDREIAETLAALVAEESGIRIRLVDRPEGQTVIEALASGYAELAIAENNLAYRPDVTTIMPLYPTVLHFLVRSEQLGTDYVAVFSGARIFAGAEGSTSRLLVERLLTFIGVPSDQVTFLKGSERSEADVIVVHAPVKPGLVPGLEGFRLVSLGTPEEIGRGGIIDRVMLMNPQMRPFIIPAGTYGDIAPEPVATVAIDKLLVARADVPEAVAYDLISEVFRLRPALLSEQPSVFGRLDDNFDQAHFAFSLHTGARAYVDRNEPSWMERYSGVAEVVVTLFVASLSGVFAAVNIYRIRRKNRIDEFYHAVFAVRQRAGDSADRAARAAAIDELRALQKRAYDMLVDEKLAADDSFQIFVSLSNDAIRELGTRP